MSCDKFWHTKCMHRRTEEEKEFKGIFNDVSFSFCNKRLIWVKILRNKDKDVACKRFAKTVCEIGHEDKLEEI